MVLADGRFVTASAKENSDLFWAVRGGGGNFGVVTSFLFKAHPMHTNYAGPMLWEMDDAPEVLRWYRRFIKKAPNELNGFFAFLTVPPGPPFPEHLHNKKMCGIVWCYTGPLKSGREGVQADLARSSRRRWTWWDRSRTRSLQSMFDPLYPPGDQWYWKADFVHELNDEAIALHLEHGRKLPTLEVDDAPVSDQRRGSPSQEQGDRVGVSRRQVGRRDRRRRSAIRRTRTRSRTGRRTTGTPCIPIRHPART